MNNSEEIKQAYRVLQAASGIEVGDKVRCIRHFKENECGSMTTASEVGSYKYDFIEDKMEGEVLRIDAEYIWVDCDKDYCGGWTFPFFALEIVEKGSKLPDDIDIGDYMVKFNKDQSIDVGCQHINFKLLQQIYKTARGIE